MTSFLLAPATSSDNLTWNIYLEVKDFIESPWEQKMPRLMLLRNPNGIIKIIQPIV